MVRRFSTRRQALPSLCAAFVLGALLSATALGCSQSPQESGGERAGGRDATTQAGTTPQKETTAPGEATQAPSEQQRQKAREQAQRQQEQARQQRQQAQQRDQQQSQRQSRQERDQQGQQGQQTVTVRVTGTEGISFSGRVGSSREMRRVEGSVPEEYELPSRGAVANAALRKQEPGGGTLGVEVVLDGEVVASKETSTAPGVLNLVWTSR